MEPLNQEPVGSGEVSTNLIEGDLIRAGRLLEVVR